MPVNLPSSDGTSSDLLSRVRARDAAAWQQLADIYGPLVYYWCWRSGLQEADAADVVQNVFIAVASAIENYRRYAGATFRGWLWTITHSKIQDHYRRARKESPGLGGRDPQRRLAEATYRPDEQGDELDEAETTALIHRTLDSIRDDFEQATWNAFWQTVVDGHRPVDVAPQLGLSANAVRQCKRRVLRRLRDELGEE